MKAAPSDPHPSGTAVAQSRQSQESVWDRDRSKEPRRPFEHGTTRRTYGVVERNCSMKAATGKPAASGKMLAQRPDDPLGPFSIAIWRYTASHRVVRAFIVQEPLHFIDDPIVVRPHEFDDTLLDRLRSFRLIAQHEHRFAQSRSLFLNPSR